MKDLYIVGAGGCGREVLQIIKDIHRIQGQRWNIKGFLDDTVDPLAGKACDYKVVGTIKDYSPKPNDVVVMAIASPEAKQALIPMLLSRGAVFETIIHPNALIGEFNSIGAGAVIYQGFTMTVNAKVGDYATLLGCGIGHDVQVGDYCTISGYCQLLGYARIGHGVFMAANSIVLPHAVVENNAYIGVSSVVFRKVKSGKRVFGNPAREY